MDFWRFLHPFNHVDVKRLILILLILLIGCTKEPDGTTYTFRKGENNATPLRPITPHIGTTLIFSFKLTGDWSDFCQHPWGLKLPAIGKLDYHDSGINGDVMNTPDSGLVFHPRYYRDGTLHVLSGFSIQTETWYSVTLQAKPLKWGCNEVCWTAEGEVDHSWLTPIYIGKINVATALRDLTIEIKK